MKKAEEYTEEEVQAMRDYAEIIRKSEYNNNDIRILLKFNQR